MRAGFLLFPLWFLLFSIGSPLEARTLYGISHNKYQTNQFQAINTKENDYYEIATFRNYKKDQVIAGYYGYIYDYKHFEIIPKIGLIYGNKKHYSECDKEYNRSESRWYKHCETDTTQLTYRKLTFTGYPTINFKLNKFNVSFGIIYRSAIISINYQQ